MENSMDPLDYLEKRIAALELQILPKNTIDDKTQEITELLLQTQTMISSALSCREAITSILQHMHTINEYLDPSHGENELEVEAKKQYLLELCPELKDTIGLISTFEHLTSYTDTGSFMKITELGDKLENLAIVNLKSSEESQEVTRNTITALQEYNDIIGSIRLLFGQFRKAISEIEVTAAPKITSEE